VSLKFTAMKDKLIKVISEYLEIETKQDCEILKFSDQIRTDKAAFCQVVAAEIVEKVLSVLEQKNVWEKAPLWANYRTTDPDGSAFYWEYKPRKVFDSWMQSEDGGRFEFHNQLIDWMYTLEERPK